MWVYQQSSSARFFFSTALIIIIISSLLLVSFCCSSNSQGIKMRRLSGVSTVSAIRNRFLSSSSSTVGSSTRPDFVTQRSKYNEQITKLRKEWQIEIKLKQERDEQQRKAERQRLVFEKAVRLRQKRIDSVIRQENAKRLRELALTRYREHLAKNQVIQEQKDLKQQEMYRRMLYDLNEEKQSWITSKNLDTKINEDLFTKQATTGIVTRTSQHWRWQIVPLSLQRLMSEEMKQEQQSESTLTDRLAQRGQIRSMKKLMVQDILDPMIGSGKDRARYKELVEKFSVQFDEMGALQWVDEYYADLLEAKRGQPMSMADGEMEHIDDDEDDDMGGEEDVDPLTVDKVR